MTVAHSHSHSHSLSSKEVCELAQALAASERTCDRLRATNSDLEAEVRSLRNEVESTKAEVQDRNRSLAELRSEYEVRLADAKAAADRAVHDRCVRVRGVCVCARGCL